MKKLSMILALVLALALVMTGCGTKKDDTAADAPAVSEDAAATENTEDTAEGGTLVMATNAEFRPMSITRATRSSASTSRSPLPSPRSSAWSFRSRTWRLIL